MNLSQSLFYWIIYSYRGVWDWALNFNPRLNPYFIGLSILIFDVLDAKISAAKSLNPYFIGLSILIFVTTTFGNVTDVSILILLDYLFL